MFQYKIKCLCLDILISSLGLATKVLAQPFIDKAVFKICVSFKVKLYPLGFQIEPQYFLFFLNLIKECYANKKDSQNIRFRGALHKDKG